MVPSTYTVTSIGGLADHVMRKAASKIIDRTFFAL